MKGNDEAAVLSQKLLSDQSFHMEFNKYLSNHAKHAVVALQGLGAPSEVIQRYWTWCEVTVYLAKPATLCPLLL
jgi:hypothetical protein